MRLIRKRNLVVPQSFGSLHCHLVFSTKGREPWITEGFQDRLYDYIGGVLRNHACPLIAVGGIEDHIHLLISLARTMAVSRAVALVKSNSSGWVHREFADRQSFAWQSGYGAFTVSYSHLPGVKRYIANQREHHRHKTFQEEFLEFLTRHDLDWDPRYIWD